MSLNAYPSSPAAPTTRKQFGRLSIAAGNLLQTVGIIIAFVALRAAQSAQRPALAIAGMISSWILLYFFAHAIAHWLIGWVLGIRFRFYTVGGTGNREGYPPGLRWIFEHLPFFGVQTDKSSMQEASPLARALMWSAGVTSSAFVPTVSAFIAWRSHVPASGPFFIFAMVWGLATLASNWTSRTGDYSKARRAFHDK